MLAPTADLGLQGGRSSVGSVVASSFWVRPSGVQLNVRIGLAWCTALHLASWCTAPCARSELGHAPLCSLISQSCQQDIRSEKQRPHLFLAAQMRAGGIRLLAGLLLASALNVPTWASCPGGWDALNNAGGSNPTEVCYQRFDTPGNWVSARDACLGMGSGTHLASVTTSNELAKAQDLVCRGGCKRLLLGFNDRDQEGTFVWTSEGSSTIPSNFWRTGFISDEPNNWLVSLSIGRHSDSLAHLQTMAYRTKIAL